MFSSVCPGPPLVSSRPKAMGGEDVKYIYYTIFWTTFILSTIMSFQPIISFTKKCSKPMYKTQIMNVNSLRCAYTFVRRILSNNA